MWLIHCLKCVHWKVVGKTLNNTVTKNPANFVKMTGNFECLLQLLLLPFQPMPPTCKILQTCNSEGIASGNQWNMLVNNFKVEGKSLPESWRFHMSISYFLHFTSLIIWISLKVKFMCEVDWMWPYDLVVATDLTVFTNPPDLNKEIKEESQFPSIRF